MRWTCAFRDILVRLKDGGMFEIVFFVSR